MTDVQKLYENLKRIQEAKGYFFNKDINVVTELLEGLITNKERYGYMACPCRLASGERDDDKDIICPCVYREPDVEEYGSCYCSLYVSKEWNEDKIEKEYVPERRPPEKTFFKGRMPWEQKNSDRYASAQSAAMRRKWKSNARGWNLKKLKKQKRRTKKQMLK